MKKEQLLLVVCLVIAALFVWMNTGLYASVGADKTPPGKRVGTESERRVDPLAGIEAVPEGRSLLEMPIREKRGPMPELAAPSHLAPDWVRPLPTPKAGAASWTALAHPIEWAPPAAGAEDGEDADDGEDFDDFDDDGSGVFDKKPKRDMTKVARLIRDDGKEIAIDVVPRGRHKDRPEWALLEDWPNVDVTVIELRPDGGEQGRWDGDASKLAAYTFRPSRNVDNEYHEERIRRGVTDRDSPGLVELAEWSRTELAKRYSVAAVRLAAEALEKAYAVKADPTLAMTLGDTYRQAYSPEAELRIYLRHIENHGRELGLVRAAAATLDRMNLRAPARELWQEAADSGDVKARLGLARNLLATGELDEALAKFRVVQGASSSEAIAGGFAGEATIHIMRGAFEDAVRAATKASSAASTDEDVLSVLGAAQYYAGRHRDAVTTLRKAAALTKPHLSQPRSNLGFALLAGGEIDAAAGEFEACIAQDALNFLDPRIGLGCIAQRRGDVAAAADYFASAATADPKNAWVLLRQATLKLAGGVDAAALEQAKAALALAPESVGALRVAGVASDNLGRPAEALEYLGRALDKDAQNTDLVYEYALALIHAGDVDRAIGFLQEHTQVGTGVGRRDGRLLILLAYAYYLNRSSLDDVVAAITRANRTENLTQEQQEYLKTMQRNIADWDATRIWNDAFERQADERLFNGWEEDDERLGPRVRCDGASALFKGVVRSSDEGRLSTSMHRTGDLHGFVESTVRFKRTSLDTEVVVHIYNGSLSDAPTAPTEDGGRKRRSGRRASAELAFVVDRDGKLWVWTPAGKRGLARLTVLDTEGNHAKYPEGDAWHTVRFVRTDDRKGRYQVLLDDEVVVAKAEADDAEELDEFEVPGLAGKSNQEYTLAIRVDADRGTDVEVRVDEVELERIIK